MLVSNAISIPIDSALFTVIAFGWAIPGRRLWQIFIFNVIIKFTVTLVSLPLIYIYPDPDWSQLHDQ
ncbi:VUT family protein [Candidatus Amarobacter glycogenicus]|uniref:VUT family protein n=1 Tax=Candidatus Amarobacter glycogenicus TaxID=3140699 RepID=UPI002A125E5A|nr:VUT family protein [Dehalococcoidia bacterium]